MKFTFDLFHGDQSPSKDFVGWVPKWWYRLVGLPIEKGVLPSGDEWLLLGWFLSNIDAADLVNRFAGNRDVETLFQTDGQFVLVIYSRSDGCVDIYRDRIGVFPIVYSKGDNGIAISIWIDNARQLAGLKSVASNAVLEQWPVYRKTFSPFTPFDSVKSLSVENSLHLKNGQISEISHFMHFPECEKYRDLTSASKELGDFLSLSVLKRIKGQNRLGMFLSGGNDSSLLVALVRKYYFDKLTTVFVTFEDNQRDYAHYAAEVSKQFETNHLVIRLSPHDYVNHWADTISILQTPVPMPCHIGIAFALRELTGKVTMMVDGDGADTVFGSSFWPQMLFLSRMGDIFPEFIRKGIKDLSLSIPNNSFLSRVVGMTLSAIATPLGDYPHETAAIEGEEQVDNIFGVGTWRKAVNFRKSLAQGEFFNALFSYLMLHGIPEDIATSMRLALSENILPAYPFLDYQLLQASMKLPNRLRYHYRIKKAPLKRYCLNYFSKDFVYKLKEGFGVPLSKWLTKKEFDPFLRLPLEGRSLRRGWWRETELTRVIDFHKSGNGTDYSAESIPWIATNLELWARICIEGDSPNLYKIGGQ